MKQTFSILILLVVFAGCKKEPLPATTYIHNSHCVDEIDSVNVRVYLVDFDTMIPHVPAAVQVNNWHFDNPYVITRSQGVVLDSVCLDIQNHVSCIDTSFSFQGMLSFCYPTEIDGLRINRFGETTMEVWSGGMKLATFYIAKTGFYDVFENHPGAFSSRWPLEAFSCLTRM